MTASLTAERSHPTIPAPRRALIPRPRPQVETITKQPPYATESEPLHIHINIRSDYTVAYFTGELDLANSSATYATLVGLLRKKNPHLILDMSGVTFTDAAGLGSLWEVPSLAARRGGWMRLARVPFCVQRIIDILSHTFPEQLSIYETVSAAAADI